MHRKIKINLLKDKLNLKYFKIIIYNKYYFKQYVINNDLLYTFFLIIKFLYKYGFILIKK